MPMVNATRRHRVSLTTIHRWKIRYGGMVLSELKRLKALEEENTGLKRIVAQQAMDIELLKEVNSKKSGCLTLLINPSRLWENGYIESFIDKPEGACLNREIF